MADYTMSAGDVAVHAKTLAAGVEDTVTLPWVADPRFAQLGAADAPDPVVMVHPGSSAPVYVSSGSVAATVGGVRCRVLWPGYALKVADVAKVRLICADAAVYSVEVG